MRTGYAIADFEAELGFLLPIRNRSGVTLTSSGQEILKSVQAVLHSNEKLKQKGASIDGLETGTVRIGAFTSVACNVNRLKEKGYTCTSQRLKILPYFAERLAK